MVSNKKVVWDEFARAALRVAYNHIRQDSVSQADKVKQEIIEAGGSTGNASARQVQER